MSLLVVRALLATALVVSLAGPASSAEVTPLPSGTDADYQLGGPVDRPGHVGIIARDRSEKPASGRYNICYVNGFQTQDDERRFWHRHWGLVLKDHGRPVVDRGWGEWLLDVRTPTTRRRLASIVDRWSAGCARDGYDAVEFDNLDSFTRSHRLIDRDESIAFARRLVRGAHRAGLAAGQKNLAGFDGTTIGFDFAVSESCARFDECQRYVASYEDQVVMVEFRAQDFRRACRGYGARLPIVLRDRDLRPGFSPRYC